MSGLEQRPRIVRAPDIRALRERKRAQALKTPALGIRGLFRIAICVVVVLAFMAIASISYSHVSNDERDSAEKSIRSEINYLCLQLESLGERADAFNRIASSAGIDSQSLDSASRESYRMLSDPVGDILSGYTLAETGTVFIASGDKVIASDDARVPEGANVRALLGDEVGDAIDASVKSDQMQEIPYKGVFDEPGGAGSYGDGDDAAYMLAAKQDGYTIVIIEPVSMVFRDRNAVMGRETFASLIILIVVGAIVDRLLSLIIARRIDKTNEVLARITSGDFEATVEEKGTREFVSLASGINVTVEALRGWISEAETRMDSELAAARAIQESALPRTFPAFPEVPQFDVYATMDAAREVGGDFYDFFLLGESGRDSNKLAFLIADVSGKGVPASLFMMKAKAQVRRELQSGLGLSKAIENANDELCDGNDACMFVTMWVGVLDYATGHMEYVNAGHNPPLFWQEGTGWRWLPEKSGLPLGVAGGFPYDTCELECNPGDKILLYTDGVTEAMSKDNELFGEDRLENLARESLNGNPQEIVKSVRSSVAAFAQDAEQSDDITILTLQFTKE